MVERQFLLHAVFQGLRSAEVLPSSAYGFQCRLNDLLGLWPRKGEEQRRVWKFLWPRSLTLTSYWLRPSHMTKLQESLENAVKSYMRKEKNRFRWTAGILSVGNLTGNLISTEKISETLVKQISWEIFSCQCTNLEIIQNHFITCLFIKTNYSACMCAKLIQLCPTLCDPMDCSPLGSSVLGDSPDKNTGVGCHALFQGIFLTQELNLCLLWFLHCRRILYPEPLGEP